MSGIEKPQSVPIKPPAQPQATPIARVAEAEDPAPAAPIVKPTVPNRVATPSRTDLLQPSVRRSASDATRPRTSVREMVINLDAARIALIAADGPPYRGSVSTDMAPGIYLLRVDQQRQLWVIELGQVKSGLRFSVYLEGPEPFSLNYAHPLLLTVHRGHGLQTQDELNKKIAALNQAIEDQDPAGALTLLCGLSDIDLYDVLDELWAVKPGVLNEVLLKFEKAVQTTDIPGQATVLRALENFARPAKEIYVDAFDSCQVHPASFAKNDERTKAGLSNVQLLLSFNLTPPRSLIVYADEIMNGNDADDQPPTYGPCCLTYPRWLNLRTTPRLHAAKLHALKEIETQNSEFIITAFKLTANVLLSVYQASLAVGQIGAAPRAPVMTRAQRGPGVWRHTFEGGSNMSAKAAEFELTSCGTPKGMGYFVDEVQFEGFSNGTLLDAKDWGAGGRMAKALQKQEFWAGTKVLNQANRQVAVAQRFGAAVEWRVSDPKTTQLIQNIFRVNNVPVRVIYIAP